MVIERSSDGGVTWKVFQYFAKDCVATYGMSPSESPSAENPLEVKNFCYTSKCSKFVILIKTELKEHDDEKIKTFYISERLKI